MQLSQVQQIIAAITTNRVFSTAQSSVVDDNPLSLTTIATYYAGVTALFFVMAGCWYARTLCCGTRSAWRPYRPLSNSDVSAAPGSVLLELTKIERSPVMMSLPSIGTVTFYDGEPPLDALRARLDQVNK